MKKSEPEKQIVELTPSQQTLINQLYDEHRYMLYNYAFSFFRNEDMSNEAVQETFRIACTKIGTLLQKENKAGWLVNVLKNTIKKAIDSKYKTAQYIAELPDDFDIEDVADDRPVDENVDILYSELAPNKDFQLIKEYVLESKSIKDIAQKYKISIAACKQRLSRGRKRFREEIEKQNK